MNNNGLSEFKTEKPEKTRETRGSVLGPFWPRGVNRAWPRRSLEGQGGAVLTSLELDPRSRPGDPGAGPRGGTPTFQGSGQVGVDSLRPWGAPGQRPEGP